jgi:hypothetical protein
MKNMSVVAMALSLAVSLFSLAHAGYGNGNGGGCSQCAQSQSLSQQQTESSDPFRKFQADTIDLRQEMMNKRFEAQRENLKGTPDAAKIAALQAEIMDLQAKILAVRSQSGLPGDKCDGECFHKMGGCDRTTMAECRKGMGMGTGGCNGPCGQK